MAEVETTVTKASYAALPSARMPFLRMGGFRLTPLAGGRDLRASQGFQAAPENVGLTNNTITALYDSGGMADIKAVLENVGGGTTADGARIIWAQQDALRRKTTTLTEDEDDEHKRHTMMDDPPWMQFDDLLWGLPLFFFPRLRERDDDRDDDRDKDKDRDRDRDRDRTRDRDVDRRGRRGRGRDADRMMDRGRGGEDGDLGRGGEAIGVIRNLGREARVASRITGGVRFVAGRIMWPIAIVASLIDVGVTAYTTRSWRQTTVAAGGAIGALALGVAGFEAGMAIGAGVGALFGGVGAIPGAIIGGVLGFALGAVGALAGDWLGRRGTQMAYDRVVPRSRQDSSAVSPLSASTAATPTPNGQTFSLSNLFAPFAAVSGASLLPGTQPATVAANDDLFFGADGAQAYSDLIRRMGARPAEELNT